MIEYAEALGLVLTRAPLLPVVTVPLGNTLGHVLADDVNAPFSIPRFSASAVDGYALRSRDVSDATASDPVRLRLAGTVRAGDSSSDRVKAFQVFRIFTGAPIPPGADAVVMQERVQRAAGCVTLVSPTRNGDNIRRRGGEFRRGDRLLRRGTLVTPPVIGLLATAGRPRIRVYRKPHVALVVTGDELRTMTRPLSGATIYDSNSPALAASLQALGLFPVMTVRVRDSAPQLHNAFIRALAAADVVIAAGGVSVGDYDLVRDVSRSIGIRSVFWRVAIKPGKPNFFGTKGRKLFFGVPGNPVAALLSFQLLVRPALLAMMGAPPSSTLQLSARLDGHATKKAGRAEFLRATLRTNRRGELVATPTRGQDSHMLGGLAASDCLIHFPKNACELRSGRNVVVTQLRWSQQ